MASKADIKEVLEFWFGDDADDQQLAQHKSGLWWGKDLQTDDQIRAGFGARVELAHRGELDEWAATANGRLALIILIDQFSRNIFRGSAQAHAGDAHALALCRQGLAPGHDQALRPIQRIFYYLPLEHAEDMACQDQSVALMQALAAEVCQQWQQTFANFVNYAEQHRDVIARFGRFPHRNEVLGRESTADELAYLSQPGAGF